MWGKLSLGHGNTASYTTVGKDLSGTADTIGYYSGPYAMAGGVYFHEKGSTSQVAVDSAAVTAGNAYTSDPRVVNVFNPYDGLSRKDRIRYDSPSFCGFSLSGSISSGEPDNTTAGYNLAPNGSNSGVAGRRYGSDIGLSYNDVLGDEVQLVGGVSLYKVSKGDNDKALKVWDASIAALHLDTGLNIALNHAKKTAADQITTPLALPAGTGGNAVFNGGTITKKPTFSRVQLGLIADLNCYGSTNFVVDYAQSKNSYVDSDKGKSYGAGVVQNLKKVNSQLYVGVRNMKYSNTSSTTVLNGYDKIFAAMAGIKINFGGKLS